MGTELNKKVTLGIRVSEMNIPINTRSPKVTITTPESLTTLPRREMFRELPFGSVPGLAPIHVDSNDVDTLVAGIVHRMGREVPNANFIQSLKHFVGRWLRENLTPLGSEPSFDDWIAGTTYTQARKDELTRIWQSLAGGPPNRKQRRRINSFIKTECYPKFKHARWINSRSDHFKAYSGPWFHAIEKQLFKLDWFIKYTPVPERAARIAALKKAGKKYFGTDFESFEAHFTPEVMAALELQLYSYMLQNYPDIADVICSTIAGANHGRTRRGVCFQLKGRRMSGDMCTSLGNGFSNLMLWLFLADKYKFTIEGFVEGDDGIFAVSDNAPGPSQLADDFRDLGFSIKIESGEDPTEMSFCGIVAADGQNIRDPADVMQSFGWTHSCLHAGNKVMLQLLRAKALSMAYELPHCPVLRAVADRALELTTGVEPRFVLDGFHQPPPNRPLPEFAPTMGTRLSFQRKFGISVDAQLTIESKLRSCVDCSFLTDYLQPNGDNVRFYTLFTHMT